MLVSRIDAFLWLVVGTGALAAQVPAVLPDPDGSAGDPTKPVQVYILAGQSNMVGMGDVGGAKNRFAGVFCTPDPAVPKGPLPIYTVGEYRIRDLTVTRDSAADAGAGAVASVYEGAFGEGVDYASLAPALVDTVPFGVADAELPSLAGPHVVVVRGWLAVPETGRYRVHPGHGTSAWNVATIDGVEVHRRLRGAEPFSVPFELTAGTRHRFTVTYPEGGGSAAFWLSQEDLLGKGDLESVVLREGGFPYLVDDDGGWTVRQDVWFQEARLAEGGRGELLSATSNGRSIGPELGFGHVLGTFHGEQVLLIKTAQGNRSLGFDFRPPSSGRNDPDNQWESLEYTLMVKGVRDTLARIDQIVPGYQGQGYELAGFAWWQGHKDGGSPESIAEYEQNLVHLIQDLRAEFDVPEMPVVVATVGFGGFAMNDKYLAIYAAQLAVADPERHPELAGKIATVDTRGFWREIDESPVSQDYHYNRNAETYLLVGEALGRAMVRLRGGEAEPVPERYRRKPAPSGVEAIATGDVDEAAAKRALAPMLIDGVAASYAADPRRHAALVSEARGDRPARPSQFPRGALYGLATIYRAAGIEDYDWRPFGPDLREATWSYFSFDPTEEMPRDKGNRFRAVTWPEGMADWQSRGFDAVAAGWRRGLPPFGQLGGAMAPLRDGCDASFCNCGTTPRTLWEHELLMIRGTFDFPVLDPERRYRLLVGGASHVNAGEGFAVFVNGKLLVESKVGVGTRQGGQPRGALIPADLRAEFANGPVTIAAYSFLRFNSPRGPLPPQGHLSVWMEEAGIPPLGEVAGSGR